MAKNVHNSICVKGGLSLLAALLCGLIAWPSSAQDEVVPDTLDWRGYYPLEVGNAWEWDSFIAVSYSRQDRREIIADTLVEGERYFVQAEYYYEQDGNRGIDRSVRDTSYLRYDTLRTRVVSLQKDGEEVDYTCDLSLDFGAMTECEYFGLETYVGGEYASEGDWVSVGDDRAPYNALKLYSNIGTGVFYYHGIGMLPGIGDGSTGRRDFTYLHISGVEYGESVILLDVESKASGLTPHLHLYPNPTHDQLTLAFGSLGDQAIAQVFDVRGRQAVPRARCSGGRCTLNVSGLPPGVYVAQVSGLLGGSILKLFTVTR